MKPTKYVEGNIELKSAEKKQGGWYCLSVACIIGHAGNRILIEEEEIKRIADVCIRWLIDHEKPPKNLRSSIG